jgi:ATP-binding cassette subfamily B protein
MWETLFRLASYVRRYWPHVLLSTALIVVSSVTDSASPYVVKMILDAATSLAEPSAILFYVGVLLGLAIVRSLAWFVGTYVNSFVSNKVGFDLRRDLFRALQSQSFTFYDKVRTGQLLSRLTSDVDEITGLVGFMAPFLLTGFLSFVISVFMMMLIDVQLSFVSMASIPVILIIATSFSSVIGPLYATIRRTVGHLSSVAQENLVGVKTVRSLASGQKELMKFDKVANELLDLSLKADKLRAESFPLMTLVIGLNTAALMWFGGQAAISGTVTIGSLVALVTYLSMVTGPIRMVGFMLDQTKRAMAGGARVFEVIDTEVAIVERPDAVDLKSARGEVEFQSVGFRYADHPTVEDVSFRVSPGERVAVVGSTGSGKTTILNLIPRFYDVTSGRVLVDGIDVRDLTISSLRKVIGVVPQEPFLFPTSMRDNITLGDKSYSDEQVIEAAKAARIFDFISSLPKGLDTTVGEMGVTLSGGQRQRISIARAILKDPRIVLLDDSTSSVDVATEKEIEEAMDSLLSGRTTFVITHRLATASRADKVVVMDRGRVVAIGRHDDLLRSSELYRNLFKDQIVEVSSKR